MAGMARAKDGEPAAERYGLKRVVKPFYIFIYLSGQTPAPRVRARPHSRCHSPTSKVSRRKCGYSM